MNYTEQVKLVAETNYLTREMHKRLIKEYNARFKATTCDDDNCNCKIDVYDFDVNCHCDDKTLYDLQVVTQHSKGGLRMYITALEIDDNVHLIESYE